MSDKISRIIYLNSNIEREINLSRKHRNNITPLKSFFSGTK